MRTILAIAGVEVRRFLADRSNIFFVFIFPLLLVFVIGAQFGGSGAVSGRVIVSGAESELRTALVEQLEDSGVQLSDSPDDQLLREELARGAADVGVVIDDSASAAYAAGGDVELELVVGAGSQAPAVVQIVQSAGEAVRLDAAQLAALQVTGASADHIRQALAQAADSVAAASVVTRTQGGISEAFAGLAGQFDLGASGQVLLFVFLVTLTASVTLIQARRDGAIKRMMAAPVNSGQAISGLALGRLCIALFQGFYIIVATWLIFRVEWGDPFAVLVLLLVFGLIGAGVAMMLGSLLDHEGAAVGLSVGIGLVLAAIGGSMVPLELFPDTLRQVAQFTPHAWAYEAFAEIQRRDGGVLDILPELGVLGAMAAGVLALGAFFLRRSLARAM